MKIAITGTTTGIGKACVDLFKKENFQITEINRNQLDLDNIELIKNIDLSNHDVLLNNAGHGKGSPANIKDCKNEDIISMSCIFFKGSFSSSRNYLYTLIIIF